MPANEACSKDEAPRVKQSKGVFSEPLFSVEEIRESVRITVAAIAILGGAGGMMFGMHTIGNYLGIDMR